MDDVDDVLVLDGDPEVMRYISGRKTHAARRDRVGDYLPAWLGYYDRFDWLRVLGRPREGER